MQGHHLGFQYYLLYVVLVTFLSTSRQNSLESVKNKDILFNSISDYSA